MAMIRPHKKRSSKVLSDSVVAEVAYLKEVIEEQRVTIEKLETKLAWFERQFKLEHARRFGKSSEADHALQADLFDEGEAPKVPNPADDEITVPAHQRKKRRSGPTISDDMVKDVVLHKIDESDRICPHDQLVMPCVTFEVRRELTIIPEQVWATEHRYEVYACKNGDHAISTPREPRISKGQCSPEAAAAIAINKIVDHLPLYRQAKRYARSGFNLDRATMARWMVQHGQALQPLVNLLGDHIMDYAYQQMDETTGRVLKQSKKKKNNRAYIWLQRGGPPGQPVVLYHYDPTRSSAVIRRLLADYEGCVQTDGYPPYATVLYELAIIHCLCNAHARRKFVETQKAIGDASHHEYSHAVVAIQLYKELYRIEEEMRQANLGPEERLRIRQEQSLPLWSQLIGWADDLLHRVRPKSHLGSALGYLIKHQIPLGQFLHNGLAEIDTNRVENQVRPYALGRKNWMFHDTEPGAVASLNLYSVCNTAMLNGHNPYAYLRHVFKELPKAATVPQFEALLPWNLAKDQSTPQSPTPAAD